MTLHRRHLHVTAGFYTIFTQSDLFGVMILFIYMLGQEGRSYLFIYVLSSSDAHTYLSWLRGLLGIAGYRQKYGTKTSLSCSWLECLIDSTGFVKVSFTGCSQ